jgi:phosphogluconate dehydratase
MHNPAQVHPVILAVTGRIRARSLPTRSVYLAQLDAAANRKPGAERMGCANVAHAFAAMPDGDKARVTGIDKFRVVAEKGPNIGIVNAYNFRRTLRCSTTPT